MGLVKKTSREIILNRLQHISSIDTDIKKAIEIERCRRSVIYWINNFASTYDPRLVVSTIPFVLFPKQEEYLLWRSQIRAAQTNGIVEKSRDVGLTWLNVASQVHSWLFEPGYKGSIGSRKELLVDRIGDMDSIMEKARFILSNLPAWMLPKGFNRKQHSHYLKLLNPNGNAITGEAGDEIGRGGRSSVYDLDEAAFVGKFKRVDAALSNNTNTIFYTSSANGMELFYQKRMSSPAKNVFTFRWQDDPRKDAAWYEGMKAKFDEVTIASEIDINYSASVEGIFIPAIWVASAIDLEIPVIGDRVAGLDVALSGKNVNVFTERHGCVVKMPISWSGLNTTETAYKARDLMHDKQLKSLNFDADGIGAGVAGTLFTDNSLRFEYIAVRGAGSPSDREWLGENRTSADKFANKRAELWGLMRDRFRKTYNYVHGVADYPISELISIPYCPALINQLSAPLGKMTSTGKILIESKQDMLKRGVGSPDYADSLAYTEEMPKITKYLLFV